MAGYIVIDHGPSMKPFEGHSHMSKVKVTLAESVARRYSLIFLQLRYNCGLFVIAGRRHCDSRVKPVVRLSYRKWLNCRKVLKAGRERTSGIAVQNLS